MMYGEDPEMDSLEAMARTLWGEARGEGDIGMEAVACIIINRVKSDIKWWGTDVKSVCLAPYQFSCWLKSDPNLPKLMAVTKSDPIYVSALDISARAINGDLADFTGGATHYHDRRMSKYPKWTYRLTPTAEIGHHLFYKTV